MMAVLVSHLYAIYWSEKEGVKTAGASGTVTTTKKSNASSSVEISPSSPESFPQSFPSKEISEKLPEHMGLADERIAKHPNAPIYTALGQVLELEGYFLESEPCNNCLVCNNPEVAMSNMELSSVKQDSKFTTTIVKLTQSYIISKIILRNADAKRTKMVRTIKIYYNNRTVQTVVELKNRPSMWHLARKVTLDYSQIEEKIEFPLPITACNLMIEYADFYDMQDQQQSFMQQQQVTARYGYIKKGLFGGRPMYTSFGKGAKCLPAPSGCSVSVRSNQTKKEQPKETPNEKQQIVDYDDGNNEAVVGTELTLSSVARNVATKMLESELKLNCLLQLETALSEVKKKDIRHEQKLQQEDLHPSSEDLEWDIEPERGLAGLEMGGRSEFGKGLDEVVAEEIRSEVALKMRLDLLVELERGLAEVKNKEIRREDNLETEEPTKARPSYPIFNIPQRKMLLKWLEPCLTIDRVRTIIGRIDQEFGIKITARTLQYLKSKWKKNKPKDSMTTGEAIWLENYKKKNPKLSTAELHRGLISKFNHLQFMTAERICAYLRDTAVEGRKYGPWSNEEFLLLYTQWQVFGTEWAKYKIPGRAMLTVKNQTLLLLSRVAKQTGLNAKGAIMNLFVTEGDVVSTEQILAEFASIPLAFRDQCVRYNISKLVGAGKLTRMENGNFEMCRKERSENKRRQFPNRSYALNEMECEHVRSQIRTAEEMMVIDWKRLSFGTIAKADGESRSLYFEKRDEDTFLNMAMRKFLQLEETLEDEGDAEFQEDGEESEKKRDNEMRVFGLIPLKRNGSNCTRNCLLFFTSWFDVLMYIIKQLQKLLKCLGCPSWFHAVVTQNREIDFERIELIQLAEGYTAALRLKLYSVGVLGSQCYNVRRQLYLELENVGDFAKRLKESGNAAPRCDSSVSPMEGIH